MIPVTIIGGYLGAGKTTLVNHLLRHADGRRIAVLVNEFGSLPIDADLIEAEDDNLISISGGCVCCSYGNDLVQALVDLGKIDPPPDHVLLETSGVALPGPIAASLSLLEGFQSEGVVVVVDAETVRDMAADPYMGDTIERQLATADLVLLNKSDLVAPEQVTDTSDWLSETTQGAAIVPVENCRIPNVAFYADFGATGHTAPPAEAHPNVPFDTDLFYPGANIDPEGVARALAAPDLNLIRAKGFIKTRDGMFTIQVVGRRSEVLSAPDGVRPGVVVIARQSALDRARLRAILACPEMA